MRLARLRGRSLPDLQERIDQVVDLWRRPVPAEGRWKRPRDNRLLFPPRHPRYCRGNINTNRRGEHKIEYEILAPDPANTETTCLGKRLIDGVNAVPLAKDTGGRRKGNVEADMLLLVSDQSGYSLQLIEVKNASNDAWYAAIEVLRQAKLFSESEQAQRILHLRQPSLKLDERLPLTAIVLAPPEFYSSAGRKIQTIEPAKALFRRMNRDAKINSQLAWWDRTTRRIEAHSDEAAGRAL